MAAQVGAEEEMLKKQAFDVPAGEVEARVQSLPQVEQLRHSGLVALGDPARQLALGGRGVRRRCLAAGGLRFSAKGRGHSAR